MLVEVFHRNHGLCARALVLLIAAALLAGCRQVGPKTIPRDRYNYGASISESWKEQTLLNMIKIRYADNPMFMDVGAIVASYGQSVGASLSATFNKDHGKFPLTSVGVGGSTGASDSPTITYSPLTNQSFIRGLMTPIRPESILLILQSGWPLDGVLSTTVKSINGLQNQTYSVNGGVRAACDFIKVVRILRDLQLADVIEFRIAPKQKDSADLTFFMNVRTEGVSERLKLELTDLRSLLKLNPDLNEYKLVWGGQPADNTEIAIQTRSVLQVLAVISLEAQIPEKHVKEGRAAPGVITQGEDSGRMIFVHSSEQPPDDAYTAVAYEGYWFWIDDKDLRSKRTFSFLMLLFSLVETGGQPAPPIITIPVR